MRKNVMKHEYDCVLKDTFLNKGQYMIQENELLIDLIETSIME